MALVAQAKIVGILIPPVCLFSVRGDFYTNSSLFKARQQTGSCFFTEHQKAECWEEVGDPFQWWWRSKSESIGASSGLARYLCRKQSVRASQPTWPAGEVVKTFLTLGEQRAGGAHGGLRDLGLLFLSELSRLHSQQCLGGSFSLR
jgi:hypothetical protein